MKCDGWITFAHETNEKVIAVHLPGCELCGGIECGDSGEDLKLCPDCLVEFRNDNGGHHSPNGRATVL